MKELVFTKTMQVALGGLESMLEVLFGEVNIECFTASSNSEFIRALEDPNRTRVTISISGKFKSSHLPIMAFCAIMTLNPVPVSLVSGKEWCQNVVIYHGGEHQESTSYFAKYDPSTMEFTIHKYGGERVHWVGSSANERWVEPMFLGETEGLCYSI